MRNGISEKWGGCDLGIVATRDFRENYYHWNREKLSKRENMTTTKRFCLEATKFLRSSQILSLGSTWIISIYCFNQI